MKICDLLLQLLNYILTLPNSYLPFHLSLIDLHQVSVLRKVKSVPPGNYINAERNFFTGILKTFC